MRLTDMPQDQADQLATLCKLRACGGYYLHPDQTAAERVLTLRALWRETARARRHGWKADDVQAGRN